MTIALDQSTASPSITRASDLDGLDWQFTDVVEPAVWVGRFNGAFVGMIEVLGDEDYLALSRIGRELGHFDTLDEAERAFYVSRR